MCRTVYGEYKNGFPPNHFLSHFNSITWNGVIMLCESEMIQNPTKISCILVILLQCFLYASFFVPLIFHPCLGIGSAGGKVRKAFFVENCPFDSRMTSKKTLKSGPLFSSPWIIYNLFKRKPKCLRWKSSIGKWSNDLRHTWSMSLTISHRGVWNIPVSLIVATKLSSCTS